MFEYIRSHSNLFLKTKNTKLLLTRSPSRQQGAERALPWGGRETWASGTAVRG